MPKNRDAGIYMIRCLANNKVYIGQASNIRERWRKHKSRLRRGVHENGHLQRMFVKYGEESFEFSLIWSVRPETLNTISAKQLKELLTVIEQCCLNIFRPEINQSPAAGSQLGYKHSAEDKAKMRLIYRLGKEASGIASKREKRVLSPNKPKGRKFKVYDSELDKVVTGVNVQAYCQENKLSYTTLLRVLNGECNRHKHLYRSKEDYLKFRPKPREEKAKTQRGDPFTIYHPVYGEITGLNLRQFCKDKGISYSGMLKTRKGKTNQCSGYFASKQAYLSYLQRRNSSIASAKCLL